MGVAASTMRPGRLAGAPGPESAACSEVLVCALLGSWSTPQAYCRPGAATDPPLRQRAGKYARHELPEGASRRPGAAEGSMGT
jgi:hypothetical protein